MTKIAGVLLLFALLTGAVHHELVAHLGHAIYVPPPADPSAGPPIGDFARGDQLLHVWALASNLHHLAHGPRALFDGNAFHPHAHTLFFSDHLFGETLAVLPLRPFTANPVLLHNVALLASFVLGATGLVLLVRELTGSVLAGVLAGLAWSFSPPRSFEIFQLQLLTLQWIPFLLLFLHRLLRRPRVATALAVGGLLVLQLLSGIYVATYFVLCLVPLVALLWLFVRPPRPGRTAALLAGALAIAAIVTAPWFVTYLRVHDAVGEYGGLLENVAYSLSLQHYLLPTWLIGSARFPGPVVVTLGVLAVVGVLAAPGAAARARWAYALVALWAAALSLGPYVRWAAAPGTAAAPAFLGRGPYALVYALVPGMDALRVPARMSLLVTLFVAVLAGFGAAAVLRRVRPGLRAPLALAFGAVIVLESRPSAPAIERLRVGAEIPPVYRWLATEPGPGAVAELPMNPLVDPLYLYYSTVHWRPLVNGYGAYFPTPYLYLQKLLTRFPDPDSLATLREIGVRWVVRHGATGSSTGQDVREAAAFGSDVVYEVLPGPAPEDAPPPLRALPRDRWRGHGDAAEDDARRAFDGDLRTSWSNVGDLTEGLLGPRGGSLAWLATLPTWDAYERAYSLRERPDAVTIDLGETVTPRRVEAVVRTHQSPGFALFALEASLDGEAWMPVACPWRPVGSVRAFAAHPADSWLAAECDFPPLRYLHVVQRPRFRTYWELAELRVLVAAR